MRKIRITESQWKTILESELGYPLDLKSGPVTKDNTAGVEVTPDPLDVDNEKDSEYGVSTTTDNISRKKMRPAQFGIRTARVAGGYRLEESRELDNMKVAGFGKKTDDKIVTAASNANSGKMIGNTAEKLKNGESIRKNTIDVQRKRLKDQAKSDPVTYANNGGKEMVKALDNLAQRTSATNNAAGGSSDVIPETNTSSTGGNHKSKSEQPTIYYFK